VIRNRLRLETGRCPSFCPLFLLLGSWVSSRLSDGSSTALENLVTIGIPPVLPIRQVALFVCQERVPIGNAIRHRFVATAVDVYSFYFDTSFSKRWLKGDTTRVHIIRKSPVSQQS
jgi:hypothetical protein